MAKRLCGAKVLEMKADVDTSMEEDSSEDDTVDGHSSNVDSSEEDMEVSAAASVGDEPWNKVTGISTKFSNAPVYCSWDRLSAERRQEDTWVPQTY